MISVLATSVVAAVSARGLAAPVVTGRVAGARGYTLLAMSRTRVVARTKLRGNGRFRLKVARDVTLQLLRPNNTFFGPVVIVHDSHRAYEALAGRGLALGLIKLHSGYAAVVKRLRTKWVDRRVWARADRAGKPVGAGNLGLLHTRKRRAQFHAPIDPATGALPPGGDPTHVGIVTAFNADVTGAGVPNAENPASAQASGDGLFSEMMMPLAMSVNDDASGVSPAAISDVVRHDLRLSFFIDGHAAGGPPVSGVSVDCGTLVYCAAGTGTATVTGPGGDGHRWDGVVPANPDRPGIFSTQIAPNVGTNQIHPGDVFLVHYRTPGGDVVAPTTLTTYFLTVPSVASYDAGGGKQSISYPPAQNAAGTPGNPIMMRSGQLTLSVWRPQRAALPGETGSFYDVGHLHYGVPFQANNREIGCGARFYSGLSPTLEVGASSQDPTYNALFPLHDIAADAPANAGDQVGFTLDLSGCMAANGIPVTGQVQLPISAVDEARQGGTDRAVQTISVCPPGCDPSVNRGPGG